VVLKEGVTRDVTKSKIALALRWQTVSEPVVVFPYAAYNIGKHQSGTSHHGTTPNLIGRG